jgi:hypothetical protein
VRCSLRTGLYVGPTVEGIGPGNRRDDTGSENQPYLDEDSDFDENQDICMLETRDFDDEEGIEEDS